MKFRVLTLLLLTSSAALLSTGCASNKSADQPMLGQRVGTYMDDAYLTSAIKTKLVGDIALKSFDIHVITKNGVVTLSGSLPNNYLRDEAIRTAKSVGGVKDVVSEIKISNH
ncbi:MAG: BON domain-containing protein [Gammaproteobacteria bacterium]|nr:BON domain-containing protein [Gammaproteobacteria bacterium]